MSKYCPECKTNFSDSFDECVYCGSSLLYGTIENNDNDQSKNKSILEMTDEEILIKYQSYKKKIEERTGTILSDREFINGLKLAKIESGFGCLASDNIDNQNINNAVCCPYCKSTNTKRITTTSKVVHTALFGIFSLSRNSKNFHCNQCDADF